MTDDDGARYLSPRVKQDLAKLDTDGDTRRLGMKSLKLFVEQLDASTLPRFISQIAESREPGATRSYAISLYEHCAKVHGKLVVPHIPKVMAAIVRSSSASGSFPQLQVACVRVTASLAWNCINSTTLQEEAEEIMREISNPLVDALSGRLGPVAANAAACLHALAETEKWKYVPEEVVHEVCERTTVALSEKPTRTAAHMQLIRILASVNPDVVSLHGANLLRAGEGILKVTANSWQLRKAAAQLLQSVLTVLDKETLETELSSAVHVLDTCRLDKMPQVRAAVSEALHTARMLGSGNEATHASFGKAASPVWRRSIERSGWILEDHVPISPASKRVSPRTPIRSRVSSSTSAFSSRGASLSPRAVSPTSQESRRLSFSPTSTSTSEYSVQAASAFRSKGGLRAKRAPVYSARGYMHSPRSCGTAGTSPSSSTTTVEECESPSHRLTAKEFDVQSRGTGMNGCVYSEEDEAGHGDNYLRPLARLSSDAFTRVLPTHLDNISGVEMQKMKDASKDAGTNVEVVLPRLKLGSISSVGQQSGPLEHVLSGNKTPMLKASSMSLQATSTDDSESEVSTTDSIQESSYGTEYTNAELEVEKREILTSGSESTLVSKLSSKHHFTPLAHLNVNFELDERTTQPVSLAKDFRHFVTPKRLVRTLSDLSIPEPGGSSIFEHDMKFSQDDPLFPGTMSTREGGEQNVETSTKAGWSVRDNPIASEGLYRTESLDEEFEARRGTYESTFSKPSLSVNSASPREIRMISPAAKAALFVDEGTTLDPMSRGESHEGDEGDHPCAACVLAEQTFISCRMRTPCPGVTSMQSPSGLSSLLHEEETKCESSTLCSTGACELCESKSGNAVEEKPSDCTSSSKEVERSERGLRGMVSQNWKKIRCFTESALAGSLCLVIALPLAMIVVKAWNGSRDCHLVPT